MFDHLSLGVTDLARASAFYDATLAPLGHVRLFQSPRAVCYGPRGFAGDEPPFAILPAAAAAPAVRFHLAFSAPSRDAVDQFHAAAVAAGGTDDGPPGLRRNYNPTYYAAFVLDPDGHRVEAVCHQGAGL
nr:VOC family protein [Kofleriaceae bacterium]